MTPSKEWRELPPQQIERALRGNRKDLDALVRWYGPVVWAAVASRIRGIPALAVQMEDLVSLVWLELCRNDWKRLRYYDRARGELGYFIRLQASQIAWSLAMRQLGRAELLPEVPLEPANNEDLESRVVSRNLLERLAQHARDHLSESDWVVFNATYVEGLTSEELAVRLEKKVKTIYQQKHRLREKLEALVHELLAADRPECSDSNDRLVQLVVVTFLMQGIAAAEPRPTHEAHHSSVEVRQPPPLDSQVR